MLLDNLRHTSKHTVFEKFTNKKHITDDICKQFTNLNKNQFFSLADELKSLKHSQTRSKSQALATYLFWLKTGLDHRTIATLFSIDNHQTISQYCDQVRNAMEIDFLPHNIGANSLSREGWTQHITTMAKELYNTSDNNSFDSRRHVFIP
jgi:hypothetical protein